MQMVLRRFFRSRLSLVGLIMLVALFVFSFAGPPVMHMCGYQWNETDTDTTPTVKRAGYWIETEDANGNETMLARVYLDKMDVKSGSAREYTMSELTSLVNESNYQKQMKSGKDYTVRVDVTVSTGEILTVAEVEISK